MTPVTFPERRSYYSRRMWYMVQRKMLLSAFLDVHIRGSLPRFWSKGVAMTEKEAEVVCALVVAERRRGGGGDGEAACIDGPGYNRLPRLRL